MGRQFLRRRNQEVAQREPKRKRRNLAQRICEVRDGTHMQTHKIDCQEGKIGILTSHLKAKNQPQPRRKETVRQRTGKSRHEQVDSSCRLPPRNHHLPSTLASHSPAL